MKKRDAVDRIRQRVQIKLKLMEIDIYQLLEIIRVTARETVSEYIVSNDPTSDEVSESQAIKLKFGRKWLAHQCAIGALTWRRAGTNSRSQKIYSLKRLKELKALDEIKKMQSDNKTLKDILKRLAYEKDN